MSTAQWGDFTVHALQPLAADGGHCSLLRVTLPGRPVGVPLVMLPGMFSNRHFWLSPKGVGLAGFLARAGYEPWLVERRGIALAANSPGRRGLAEHIAQDLPQVQRTLQQHNPRPAFWFGHSFGGVMATLAAAETLDPSLVAGLVLFAAQCEVDKNGLTPPYSWFLRGLSRMLGRFPARRLGMGPEDEPPAAMDDACAIVGEAQREGSMARRLAPVRCPVLGFGGGADRVDPPEGCVRFIGHMSSGDKTWVLLSRDQGYSKDYDHPGIVIAKAAQDEVWPQVLRWLQSRHR
ncbi:alpha/beta fold hydrolase [Solimonas sp. K1W22B-7]|uniref:alpha/beta fold hydrolase n=1 Tax=Solimonas sp. K1W22B-7 TaxID=2303331 RepID=UPI000E3355BC|nr:alpha/beta fold hydrolase [Solimonas sp. K1W22B-7]AXQ29362.1 alpha/beta fold hydrolase [Solimonas sp. K1W22B-7]